MLLSAQLETAGPGFINIFVKRSFVADQIAKVRDGKDWNRGDRYMDEYRSRRKKLRQKNIFLEGMSGM